LPMREKIAAVFGWKKVASGLSSKGKKIFLG
jgi:hypothetical protein